jgi:protein-S-isoprenylcysteine O-methyltransferase Ste14
MATQPPNGSRLRILTLLASPFLYTLILFALAGTWQWIQGWVFAAWWIIGSTAVNVHMYRRDPALLAERLTPSGTSNDAPWDKYYVFVGTAGFAVWLVIMPLDAQRYLWTPPPPLGVQAIGLIALGIAFFFRYRSFTDNTFLSTTVRIQSERDQRVVSTGVYSVVRHPLYISAILLYIGAPLLLGSLYGVLIGIVIACSIVARTLREERLLIHELDGYADYTQKVRYRLIPFVW